MLDMAPVGTNSMSRNDGCYEGKSNDFYSWTPVIANKVQKRFTPMVVALAGLPARGKTVLAQKLQQYLIWKGYCVKVFSVSNYRRKHVELYDSHDLFRFGNEEAYEIRKLSALEAMEDASDWLNYHGNVAILDGTHATTEARHRVYNHFVKKLGFKLLFVECVCDDDAILNKNIKEILQFSTDYCQMSKEKALDDFHHKIEHYMEVYETINGKSDANFPFIKYFNNGENITTHKVCGAVESIVLNYLSNYRAGSKTLYFSRHGESEYNVLGRIGGDTNLSPRGQKYAATLSRYINEANIPDLHVWTSEKRRTIQTAQDIIAPKENIGALNELDAGVCEGLSYEEMQEKYPQEFAWRDQDKLRYRYPWGESYIDIMNRLEPVLLELEHEENLLVISHQAVLRCILGYFLQKSFDELPYINVPLHTVIKLTTEGYKSKLEFIKLNVECVDTYRKQPKNCSVARTQEDALLTVPAHYDSLNIWSMMTDNTSPMIQQN